MDCGIDLARIYTKTLKFLVWCTMSLGNESVIFNCKGYYGVICFIVKEHTLSERCGVRDAPKNQSSQNSSNMRPNTVQLEM